MFYSYCLAGMLTGDRYEVWCVSPQGGAALSEAAFRAAWAAGEARPLEQASAEALEIAGRSAAES